MAASREYSIAVFMHPQNITAIAALRLMRALHWAVLHHSACMRADGAS